MYRKVFLANQLRQSFERRHGYKHALPCLRRCARCEAMQLLRYLLALGPASTHSRLGSFPLRPTPIQARSRLGPFRALTRLHWWMPRVAHCRSSTAAPTLSGAIT